MAFALGWWATMARYLEEVLFVVLVVPEVEQALVAEASVWVLGGGGRCWVAGRRRGCLAGGADRQPSCLWGERGGRLLDRRCAPV